LKVANATNVLEVETEKTRKKIAENIIDSSTKDVVLGPCDLYRIQSSLTEEWYYVQSCQYGWDEAEVSLLPLSPHLVAKVTEGNARDLQTIDTIVQSTLRLAPVSMLDETQFPPESL
jgi:hypothetical protein